MADTDAEENELLMDTVTTPIPAAIDGDESYEARKGNKVESAMGDSLEDLPQLKIDNDYLERSDRRCHQATMDQAIDSTFFSTMRISELLHEVSSKDPLHSAIASRDEIDVQMILDELGNAAASSISARDREGRTALHIAATCRSSNIVGLILNSYRVCEERQLSADLDKLTDEYSRTIAEVVKSSDRQNMMPGKFKASRNVQSSSVKEWFDMEKDRRMRQLEFRCEVSHNILLANYD